jgi:hypothetical protein
MKELIAALAQAQAEFPRLQKRGVNPHFGNKFVRLEDLLDAVMPVLRKHGLLMLQMPEDGHLRTLLVHVESGESITTDYPIRPARPDDPQALGSAVTYARRYALQALLGIAGEEDDDAEAATARPETGPVIRPAAPRSEPIISHEPQPAPPETEGEPVPPPACKVCGKATRFRPAGTSKDGRPYEAFWSCPDRCKGGAWKDSEWREEWGRRKQDIPF